MSAKIGILGAGRMGRGIAVAYMATGHDVALIDMKARESAGYAAARQAAEGEIEASLSSMRHHGVLDAAAACGRALYATPADLADVLPTMEVVFEGVPEVMDAKRDVFAAVEPHLAEDAVVASTSSTFLSTDVAKLARRPGRFANAHWLNPAFLIPLVEVSPHAGTDADAIERLTASLKAAGKVPVLCGAAPGYIVPRLQVLVMNEVARMVEEGVATAEDVDLAIRHGFGPRYAAMGVAEFIDFGGMDILHYASGYMANALDQRFASPDIVARNVSEGKAGARDGVGFYDWRDVDLDAYRDALLTRFVERIALTQSEEDHPRPRPIKPGS